LQNGFGKTHGVRPGQAPKRLPEMGGISGPCLPFWTADMAFSGLQVPWHVATAGFTNGRRCECAREMRLAGPGGFRAGILCRCEEYMDLIGPAGGSSGNGRPADGAEGPLAPRRGVRETL